MRKRDWTIITFIFFVGFYLRVMFLPGNTLTFGYDQARDALVTQQILAGDFKILGPPASTPGLYHGVFYYYFLAPAYLFGRNPVNVAYWAALFNAATVFVVAALTYLMTKKRLAAFLAAFLFALSFEAIQYATWLSNPTIGIWTVPLFYLGLWLWVDRSRNKFGMTFGPVLTALGLGVSIQAEIFLAYHIVPLIIWLVYSKRVVTKKQLASFILVLGLVLSTMLLVEFKFGFKGLSGLQALAISHQPLAYAKSLGDYLVLYLNQIGRIFAFNSYPGNIGYGGAFVIVLTLLGLRRERQKWGPFLATWLFSHLTVVTVGGTSTPFLMVGIGPAVSILLAIWISRWWGNNKLVAASLVAVLVFGNLSMIMRENKRGSTLFAIQPDMLLSKQLAAIDYTYEKAGKEPFSVNTLTSPLDINIVWSYLYKWYGQEKYGYIPEYHGRDQIGQLDALSARSPDTSNFFLILEPMGGIPVQHLELKLGEENVGTKVVDEVYWGELRVQERTKI
ncbi:hypothetical protein A3F62_00255 [Candidatus Woesebacteria bacterium RIFCSPHIGHO2_12_FULL_44_11]|uniref:Glycosyltransferase RgtA/B/C/D-like domain-containing protein n=1 Tax=Candidatus Woesebacteria bacterium RIFCSPLOWO2_01_FULL_44_14 TaxID=1802525 RepID=A0A1F8C2W6_9BACT|nr:MAG: hypothetical protein A3F62_00255 [Candidatus Woesebacteria bacterium RIFCSPHIGHO2_12_FULL_44_11]OGM69955.1 MAG: hypothetical protein A2975_05095 [Candidatus Woesebacteria bacterium RIFCSPLOWO2_01_FULL_44_14]